MATKKRSAKDIAKVKEDVALPDVGQWWEGPPCAFKVTKVQVRKAPGKSYRIFWIWAYQLWPKKKIYSEPFKYRFFEDTLENAWGSGKTLVINEEHQKELDKILSTSKEL